MKLFVIAIIHILCFIFFLCCLCDSSTDSVFSTGTTDDKDVSPPPKTNPRPKLVIYTPPPTTTFSSVRFLRCFVEMLECIEVNKLMKPTDLTFGNVKEYCDREIELKNCLSIRELTINNCVRAAHALKVENEDGLETLEIARFLIKVENIRHYICSYHWRSISENEECFLRKMDECVEDFKAAKCLNVCLKGLKNYSFPIDS